MPDHDIVPNRISRHFRGTWQMVLSGSPSAMAGDELRLATTGALRAQQGCRGLQEYAMALRDTALYGDMPTFERNTERFLVTNGRRPLANLVVREAEASLAADADDLRSRSDKLVAHDLAEHALARFAEEQMVGREPQAMLKRFATMDEANVYVKSMIGHASFGELADGLLRHQDGSGLRAPNSRIPKAPMSELMNLDLES